MHSIAVCIAAFNRRERTLACLDRLHNLELPANTKLVVHLLDDASPDRTAAAVAERFPKVRLHHGDGQYFWAGGMRVAYDAALTEEHEFYVWLNDDVELFVDALLRAWLTYANLQAKHGGEHLIVGAMLGRDGATTYSGFERASRILPWKFRLAPPLPDLPRECATLNGNFVFIPAAAARRIGGIDGAFVQMHADLVLGLTARRIGARVWVMPGHAGVCEANTSGRKNWKAPGLSIVERWQIMGHPLGYPLGPSVAYARHFGLWAPVMIAAPYLGLAKAIFASARGRKAST
jgi:GT2 family glycosyltransferase